MKSCKLGKIKDVSLSTMFRHILGSSKVDHWSLITFNAARKPLLFIETLEIMKNSNVPLSTMFRHILTWNMFQENLKDCSTNPHPIPSLKFHHK